MKMRLAFGFVLTSCLLPSAVASPHPTEPAGYPQIVRLSAVEGDVRISRDKQQGQARNVDWEKAVAGLPLASGFSLATGNGRAEIELENASTFYLAENSVVVLNSLETAGDVPHTEVALITGTVTLCVRPSMPGEQFILRTPTDTLSVLYPGWADLRVTGYMDAVAITPTGSGRIHTASGVHEIDSGKTNYFRAGRKMAPGSHIAEGSFADWDAWVNNHYAARTRAMEAMEKQTGLQAPVPGLDRLAGHGRFEDCGEYGPCWEPPSDLPAATIHYGDAPAAPARQSAAAETPGSPQQFGQSGAASGLAQPSVSGAKGAKNAIRPNMLAEFDPFFPCDPYAFYFRAYYPFDMRNRLEGDSSWWDMYPWRWAVCHTGGWVYRHNRYLWVPGRKRHHRPPVRWVKDGRKNCYVPLHPRDEKGKAPLNVRHGLFVAGKNGPTWQRIDAKGGSELKPVSEAPREFRKGPEIRLARADAPHMEARSFASMARPGDAHPAVPILFDHKSQSFMAAHEVREGNNVRTVTEPVGSYVARSGAGFGGPSPFHGASGFTGGGRVAAINGGGGNSGSGFRGGGTFTGSSSAGGAAHSSGFSGGGNFGGFHGGGGGGGGFSGGGGGFSGGSHAGGGSSGGGGGASGGGSGHH